jgi:dUTP pyrophosphatase
MTLKWTKIDQRAKGPTRKNYNDVGADIYACLEDNRTKILIPIGEAKIVHTGIAIDVPEGTYCRIAVKSRHDYLIGGGVVDPGYRGELLVKIINVSKSPIEISHHEAIAQIIFEYVYIPEDHEEVTMSEFNKTKTSRGIDGGIARQAGVYVPDDDEEENDAHRYDWDEEEDWEDEFEEDSYWEDDYDSDSYSSYYTGDQPISGRKLG